ncbi:bifunctional PIG-L family deacetylase/class I SAM-dependent methyltransferase [Sinomonas humi]|uniref:Methyltransferase domain-containing protein n=1 Tax=Sinomonas humi TaxID=1338436 RepID=A0A0B2ABD2_9MICC|nr:bifunctional PIG-L family deacetylase/class I SAM-dependent methyltransferase [Sinomonas humi]KHL00495.1 hypothetical protein LK10_20130 [Sinomonas humi]
MVTFSHHDASTPESEWRGDTITRDAPDLDLRAHGRLVVLAAHPDDETLGAGGLIAEAGRRGWPVDVVIATDGEGSHPGSPTHSPSKLAALRRREVEDAVRLLAPGARIHCAGIPDGSVAENSNTLARVLRTVLREREGQVPAVVLAAPWRRDGHTDHDAAGEIAARVAKEARALLLEYPIWLWHWGTPGCGDAPWDRGRRFRLDPDLRSRKAAALAAHASQTGPLSELPGDEALLSPGMQEHFDREAEFFFVTPPPDVGTARDARAVFDELHGSDPDPWQFESSWYEARKRALTLASLPSPRYRRVLEMGCSIGVLTGELAERADAVVATDVSQRALDLAAARMPTAAAIAWERRRLPAEWPEGRFDLIVMSEVGYYFSHEEFDDVVRHCLACLDDGGALVACHWLGPIEGWTLTGAAVHARLRSEPGLALLAHHEEEDFVLDVFVRPPAVSVARREGIA